MTSDVGMFKPIVPAVVQTSPTASAGRVNEEVRTTGSPNTIRKTEESDKTEKEPQEEPLDSVVSDLNQLVRDLQRELRFSVDKESGETVIKVIDRETDEILRQIPSEDLMRLRKRLEEAAGVIFRDSA